MLFTAVSSLLKSRAALQFENVALRHQIGVLQRSRKEAPTVECVRSLSVGLAFSSVDRLAFGARDREAANSGCMAPQGIPDVLDVEDPERKERASGGLTGGSRPDPTDEP